jgi:TnpA family transposase
VATPWPNIAQLGAAPLGRSDIPALTRARLAWIQQNYMRADTIIIANARLVDVHAALPLTEGLGSAELASAEGCASSCRSARSTWLPTQSISAAAKV